jgi:hypothetical protein
MKLDYKSELAKEILRRDSSLSESELLAMNEYGLKMRLDGIILMRRK